MTRPGRRRRADSPYAEQAARLAAWLRDRREQAQLSQQQLAARAELAVATVRKIETGAVIEPGYFTILALQQALGARYEDTTALPARLTLPPLVEPFAGGALSMRRSQPRALSPLAVRWSSSIAAVRASSSDRAGTSTVTVGSAARSTLPCS
jgi:transcriptional regulator with XRE-family HTH domain